MARCLICGCTEDNACATKAGPCYWVALDKGKGEGLCSACAHKALEIVKAAADNSGCRAADSCGCACHEKLRG